MGYKKLNNKEMEELEKVCRSLEAIIHPIHKVISALLKKGRLYL
jgi:hypothetical protein